MPTECGKPFRSTVKNIQASQKLLKKKNLLLCVQADIRAFQAATFFSTTESNNFIAVDKSKSAAIH